MFDPKAFLDAAFFKLHNTDKAEVVREMLELVAGFIDKHDILVPDLHVKVGMVDLSLSVKKVEDQDASKKVSDLEVAKNLSEADTDPNIKTT